MSVGTAGVSTSAGASMASSFPGEVVSGVKYTTAAPRGDGTKAQVGKGHAAHEVSCVVIAAARRLATGSSLPFSGSPRSPFPPGYQPRADGRGVGTGRGGHGMAPGGTEQSCGSHRPKDPATPPRAPVHIGDNGPGSPGDLTALN
ncbi:Hypp4946 [Branchiostoma lanceolatum]|uniref:Hypp4946 protein n=1 Tax=Branchiostoma lanceolatum TaxID=7740 RepID=A0A8K0EZX8_BRALA|nr:Hypp4946 [Branchiostoma lanceolatum]